MKILALSLLLASTVWSSAAAQRPGGPQGFPPDFPGGFRGPGGRGGPNAPDIEIVKEFDRNKDGWLNTAERKAARESVRASGAAAFGPGRGGRGGRGFPGGRGFDGPAEKGVTIRPSDVRAYPQAPFYDESVLRTLFFTFENNDWENELEDFHGTDVDVPAALQVDGRTYRDVGLRFRGNSSYMGVPEGRKRSLNVTLDMAHEDQNVGGYRTLNLLNSHEDPTMLRAVLFLHVARHYIPAPKANFVRVVINGENWGIYANVQQFNKDFLREHYRETEGSRWKAPGMPNGRAGLTYLGDDIASYKNTYDLKTRDDSAQWTALLRLTKVLTQTPPAQLEQTLAPVLDIEGALKFLALDNALVNNDGYWTRASDYSMYRDKTGRFHIVPHDTNETFAVGGGPGGRGGRRGPPGPGFGFEGPEGFPPPGFGGPGGRGPGGPGGGGPDLDPLIGLDDPGKPLRSRLLTVPALRERYLRYVRDIAATWLDWRTLGPLVQQYRTLIAEEVKRDTKKLESYDAFTAGIDGPARSLRTFAAARRARLLQ